MNYNEVMKNIIKELDGHNKLLLHSCCAPCSSSVIERLRKDFKITVLYYNPNIEPEAEYLKRKSEQIRFLTAVNIPYEEIDYANEDFRKIVKGYEAEPENGLRCRECYQLRLQKTSELALKNGYDYFGTTLTVSPHKNSQLINELGMAIQASSGVKYLASDFKKEAGYKRSIELAKEHQLYRQDYCGCLYSKGRDNEE